MFIDSSHRNWFIGAVAGLVAACAIYGFYVAYTPARIFGGTALGLTYGGIGLAMMLVAGLLGARRKLFKARNQTLHNIAWRKLGRIQYWMRAHLWLGLLSFPIILLHSGFTFGPRFSHTWVLMWLFVIVTVSGLIGAALQHFMPMVMTNRVPMEVTYDQIGAISQKLLDDANDVFADNEKKAKAAAAGKYQVAAGGLTQVISLEQKVEAAVVYSDRLKAFCDREVFPYLGPVTTAELISARTVKRDAVRAGVVKNIQDEIAKQFDEEKKQLQAALKAAPKEQKAELTKAITAIAGKSKEKQEEEVEKRKAEIDADTEKLLLTKVTPAARARDSILANRETAEEAFNEMRVLLPQDMGDIVDTLENICIEQRQLRLQTRLHRWLHGWLLVHIPISYAVLLLAGIHAVIALRY